MNFCKITDKSLKLEVLPSSPPPPGHNYYGYTLVPTPSQFSSRFDFANLNSCEKSQEILYNINHTCPNPVMYKQRMFLIHLHVHLLNGYRARVYQIKRRQWFTQQGHRAKVIRALDHHSFQCVSNRNLRGSRSIKFHHSSQLDLVQTFHCLRKCDFKRLSATGAIKTLTMSHYMPVRSHAQCQLMTKIYKGIHGKHCTRSVPV